MSVEPVTVAVLVYRSPAWLDFCLEGLHRAKNETPIEILVVANDPEPQVLGHQVFKFAGGSGNSEVFTRPGHVFHNPDPTEHHAPRVYRAWNYAVEQSATSQVIIYGSDFYASDGWVDELVACRQQFPMSVPTSRSVESGRRWSYFNTFMDFGVTPSTFRRDEFVAYADEIRKLGEFKSGLMYQPALFDREAFLEHGGYPTHQIEFPPGSEAHADQALMRLMEKSGWKHMTAWGSVVYHAQHGEATDAE